MPRLWEVGGTPPQPRQSTRGAGGSFPDAPGGRGQAERGPGGQTVRPALSPNGLVTDHGPCCLRDLSPDCGNSLRAAPHAWALPRLLGSRGGTQGEPRVEKTLAPAFASRAAGGGTRAAPHSRQSLGGGGEREGPRELGDGSPQHGARSARCPRPPGRCPLPPALGRCPPHPTPGAARCPPPRATPLPGLRPTS